MVTTYDDLPAGAALTYVVIAAHYRGDWLCCRHRNRTTWELPGGHIEAAEAPIEAAKRELFEETGALDFAIRPMGYYSVRPPDGTDVFGALYYAAVKAMGPLPTPFEMAEARAFSDLPANCTYPHIQPVLLAYIKQRLTQ